MSDNDLEKYKRALLAQNMRQAYESAVNDPKMKLWRLIERGIIPADRLEEADQLVKEEMALLEFERAYHEQLCAEAENEDLQMGILAAFVRAPVETIKAMGSERRDELRRLIARVLEITAGTQDEQE